MLYQIRYYFGEESSHDTGFELDDASMSVTRENIKRGYKEYQIKNDLFLFDKSIIEIPKVIEDKSKSVFMQEGQLGLRVISEGVRNLKKTIKELELPFNKKVVVPYKF